MIINSSRNSQKGSMQIVIIIVVIAVILGVLGFVLWQNFSKTGTDDTSRPAAQETPEKAPPSSGIQLSATSTIDNDKISLKYPEEWTLATEGTADQGGIMSTKLLSPDSKVIVEISHSKGFYGDGACGNADAIVLYERTNVESTDKLKVVSIIYTFPASGYEGTDDYYPQDTYLMSGIVRTNALNDIELGGSICSLHQGDLFDSDFEGFEYGKPAARASIRLPLLESDRGSVKPEVSVNDIRKEMQSKSYRQAVEILANLTVTK